ncbi:MAG TPA: hypothetical protein RMG48_03430 [Myxococcales bacterium LLY-WYZ-16_1]|jgi:hypothetical protein|nr:hypothetical protein [Myxococcales bacterium LLY-WYZ-16_1]
MSDADEILLSMLCALEKGGWNQAQSLARSLAHHIDATGEYPSLFSAAEIELLVRQHRSSATAGPS